MFAFRKEMADSIRSWSKGAKHALDLGEGNPEAWQRLDLRPLPGPWQERLQSTDELLVGLASPKFVLPDAIGRIAGGACIHRSRGVFEQLPISFLWETLTVAMVGKLLDRSATVLLPIAEESAREQSLGPAYHELGSRLADSVQRLGAAIGVQLKAYWKPQLERLEGVANMELYGLFHPFSSSPRLRCYPLGEPDEDAQLRLNASYCARYRTWEGGLQCNDLIVEGIHVAQSVLIGVRSRANYLATVPLPAPTGHQLQTDATTTTSISQTFTPQNPDWWPNRLAINIFELDLESLRKILVT